MVKTDTFSCVMEKQKHILRFKIIEYLLNMIRRSEFSGRSSWESKFKLYAPDIYVAI